MKFVDILHKFYTMQYFIEVKDAQIVISIKTS